LTEKIQTSPDYGNRLGHWFFYILLRLFGPTPAYWLLAFVVPWYVFLLRKPRQQAAWYLKMRFFGERPIKRLWRTYIYIFRFGQTLIDQAAMGILGRDKFTINFPGWQDLYALSEKANGMVLLTSHVGYWKTAMSVVDDLAVPVNFLIHLEEHMEGRHFFDLAGNRKKIKVIDPTGFMGGLVEATEVLETGECVSIMGDRAFGARTIPFDFLGEPAHFPLTPYHLVTATDSELVLLLTVRTGKLAFNIDFFYLSEDEKWKSMPRKEAQKELLKRYVVELEKYTKQHPYMWFNFFNFWKKAEHATEGTEEINR